MACSLLLKWVLIRTEADGRFVNISEVEDVE